MYFLTIMSTLSITGFKSFVNAGICAKPAVLINIKAKKNKLSSFRFTGLIPLVLGKVWVGL